MEEIKKKVSKYKHIPLKHNKVYYHFEQHLKNPFNNPNKMRFGNTLSSIIYVLGTVGQFSKIAKNGTLGIEDPEDQTTRVDWQKIKRPVGDTKPDPEPMCERPVEVESKIQEETAAEENKTLRHSSTTPRKTTYKTLLDSYSIFGQLEKQKKINCADGSNVVKQDTLEKIEYEDFEALAEALQNSLTLSPEMEKQFKLMAEMPKIHSQALWNLTTVLPPPKTKKLTNKTIVFDMDGTLVCTFELKNKSELVESKYKKVNYPDDKDKKVINTIVVDIRPYAIEILKQLSPYAELILFTASEKTYADAVINELDPNGEYFDHRLYRDKCLKLNKSYLKDLRIINRDLHNLAIIENSIVAFCSQLENGIYIPTYTGDSNDKELNHLTTFLLKILVQNDIRIPITEKYGIPSMFKVFKTKK